MNFKKFVEEFQKRCKVDEDSISVIEDITKSQAQSQSWFQYRKGRVTASIVKEVMAKISSSGEVIKDSKPLVKK